MMAVMYIFCLSAMTQSDMGFCCLQQDCTWNAAVRSDYQQQKFVGAFKPIPNSQSNSQNTANTDLQKEMEKDRKPGPFETWCQFLSSFLHATSKQTNSVPLQRYKGKTPTKENPISKSSFPPFSSLTLTFSVVT